MWKVIVQMEKRNQIIDAAIKVFVEKGIEKTKISDIVKEAGIGQGTFYLYFPSKLSVMPAIAEVMVQKIINGLNEQVTKKDFLGRLEQTVDVFFTLTDKYRETFTLIYAGLAQTQHVREWEMIYTPVYEWMISFLNTAIESGEINSSVNPDYMSKMLVGLIESSAEQVYLYEEQISPNVSNTKKELLLFIQRGLGVQSF